MALLWTLFIMTSIKNISLLSGAFASQFDEPVSAKNMHRMSPNSICQTTCNCSGSSNLTIDCRFKKLNIFPENLNSSVYILNLSGNNISILSYNYTLDALSTLILTENNISLINNNWVSSLSNLTYLDLSKNRIDIRMIENVFQNLNLVYLDLSSNIISETNDAIFSNLFSLQMLNLSNNNIDSISSNSFKDLTYLVTLDLSNNLLNDLQHDWFINFKKLDFLNLRQNNLKFLRNVVFSTLKELKMLDLSHNCIKSIGLLSFKGLKSLNYLNLSHNHISQIQEGVFRSLEVMQTIDLSHNPIVKIDRIFFHLKALEFLIMRNVSSFKELTQFSLVGLLNLKYFDISESKVFSSISLNAFSYTPNLEMLDLSNTNLSLVKMGTFNDLKLKTLKLNGNPWNCDCYMYWLLLWLGEHTNTYLLSPSETFCSSPPKLKHHVLLDALDHNMICTNASIFHYTNKTKFKVGAPAFLECKVEGTPLPSLTWITPGKETFHWDGFQNQTKAIEKRLLRRNNREVASSSGNSRRFYIMHDGNLAIQNVERGDGGFYKCIASNPLSYDSVSIRLTLDYEYLVQIKIVSVLVGMATSFSFLLLTLIAVLIKMIMKHFGLRCPCYNGNASPRTQQIKKILESMEHYKKQQLDRLRDNYNGQVARIKDNCMQQMERLRESYSSQAERLRDIKEYGTLQIDRIRENYYFQVQRVRDYSTGQIIRLRENYDFQRNRIRKFSAHHLYKLRENYKVQQQHLNKILENFNIESCRNVCQRTDSIVFEPDITFDNVLVPKICLQTLSKESCDSNDNSSQLSAYFTPDEASEVSGHESDECENFDSIPKANIPNIISINIEKIGSPPIVDDCVTSNSEADTRENPPHGSIV